MNGEFGYIYILVVQIHHLVKTMVDYKEPNALPQGASEPGVFILPVYTHGTSPFTVEFEIHATPGSGDQIVKEYAFSPGDGMVVKGTFVDPPEDGVQVAIVSYTYVYVKSKSSKYTGRTFYPDVTIKTAVGAVKTMNHNNQRETEIWVVDPKYAVV